MLIDYLEISTSYHRLVSESASFMEYASRSIKNFTTSFRSQKALHTEIESIVYMLKMVAIASSEIEYCRTIIIEEIELLLSLVTILDCPQILENANNGVNGLQLKIQENQILCMLNETVLMCLLSFTRSIRHLRTKLYDCHMVRYVRPFLTHESLKIRHLALKIICNLVLVFSPFRDDFTDKTSLAVLRRAIDIKEFNELTSTTMLLFKNLAYWSSREFAENLIETLSAEQLIACFFHSLEYKSLSIDENDSLNRISFLMHLLGFLRNITFERQECDEIFFKNKYLFSTVIKSLISSGEGPSNDLEPELNENLLLLILNCVVGKRTKIAIINDKTIMSKLMKDIEQSSKHRHHFVIVAILKELVGFGYQGYKERLNNLRTYGFVPILKSIGKSKNEKLSEASGSLLELFM